MHRQAHERRYAFLFIARGNDEAQGLRRWARGEEFIHEAAADCEAQTARGGVGAVRWDNKGSRGLN